MKREGNRILLTGIVLLCHVCGLNGQGLINAFLDFASVNSPVDMPGANSSDAFPGDPGFPEDPFPADPTFPADPFPSDQAFPGDQFPGETPFPGDPLPIDPVFPTDPLPAKPVSPDVPAVAIDQGLPSGLPDNSIGKNLPVVEPANKPQSGLIPNDQGLPAIDTAISMFEENVGTNVDPQVTDISNTNPIVDSNTINQMPSNTDPKPEIKLDFQFLPNIPRGDSFVNLRTGTTNNFDPTGNWLDASANIQDSTGNTSPNFGDPLGNVVDLPAPAGSAIDNTVDNTIQPDTGNNVISDGNFGLPIGPVNFGVPLAPVDIGGNTNFGMPVLPSGLDSTVDSIFKPVKPVDIAVPVTTTEKVPVSEPLPQDKPIVTTDVLTNDIKSEVVPVDNTVSQKGTDIGTVDNTNGIPTSWMTLYPNGRPDKPKLDIPAREEVAPMTPTEQLLSEATLNTFSRDRSLTKRLREHRKLMRKQGRERMKAQRQQMNVNRQQNRGRGGNRGRGNNAPAGFSSIPRIPTIARMVLPGQNQPFVGKNQRGRGRGRRAPSCTGRLQMLGLCSLETGLQSRIEGILGQRKKRSPRGRGKGRGNNRGRGRGWGRGGGGDDVGNRGNQQSFSNMQNAVAAHEGSLAVPQIPNLVTSRGSFVNTQESAWSFGNSQRGGKNKFKPDKQKKDKGMKGGGKKIKDPKIRQAKELRPVEIPQENAAAHVIPQVVHEQPVPNLGVVGNTNDGISGRFETIQGFGMIDWGSPQGTGF